ncbi:MAG: spore germination protein, partial [Clostridia bacterium]|nr:spore germination protein [Clostridia bacterium]
MEERLSSDYAANVAKLDALLRVKENFDVIKKPLVIGNDELTFYYIDGFIKDAIMSKLMMYLVSLKGIGKPTPDAAKRFLDAHVPYVETEVTESLKTMTTMMLSGAALMIGSSFGDKAILIDARTYPARETAEPENDRVMLGSRDGFVETLIFNTALIRRRIRDTSLTMHYMSVGSASATDVVVSYMKGRADEKNVDKIIEKLKKVKTESLTLGHQSLTECLVKSGWYNPFPKVRTTER